MFGAFFIITDPVSSAVSNKGRLIFGAMVGILVYLIRVYGNYPDAVAFGVLLLNFAAPLIDQYTQLRVLIDERRSKVQQEHTERDGIWVVSIDPDQVHKDADHRAKDEAPFV